MPILKLEQLEGLVPSDVLGRPPYKVDLSAYDGNGKCNCKDFDIRHKPLLEDGERPGNRTRCKHILRFRRELHDSLPLELQRQFTIDELVNGYLIRRKRMLHGRSEKE